METPVRKQPILGPIEIDVKVHVVDPVTGNSGVVTYSLSPGRVPTEDFIKKAISESYDAVKDQGLAVMAPSTFFNYVLVKNKFGRVGNFAVPGEFDYTLDVPTADVPRSSSDNDDEYDDADED